MNYQAKQDELDKIKWIASEKKGADACGDFDFCACCDKNLEFPCAAAADKAAAAATKSKQAAKPKTEAAKPAIKAEQKLKQGKPEKETAATADLKPSADKAQSAGGAISTAKSAAAKSTAKKPAAKN